MTTTQAISSGLSATRRAAWMVFLFYACNLLLAGAIAAPMHTAIADHLGHSAVGQQLARDFSASWLAEFQIAQAGFLHSFSLAIVYAGILFLALNTVLSAGAFEVFKQSPDAKMHAFGRGIGKYFGRFARLAVIASVFYFVLFWFWQGPVAKLVERMTDQGVLEWPHFYLEWIRLALLFATVFVVNSMMEYAKADIVLHDHSSALAALGHAGGFVVKRFVSVMTIYVALGTLTALTIFVYAAFARYFPQSSVATILIWFLVAQALLWLRWMFRLASWGAAVAYYGASTEPATEPLATSAEAHA